MRPRSIETASGLLSLLKSAAKPPAWRLGLALAAFSLAIAAAIPGCSAPPSAPHPAPDGGTIPGDGIAGLVMAPPAMQKDGGVWDGVRPPLNEAPLADAEVFVLGARGEAMDIPATRTDAQGIFRFNAVPAEAGLLAINPKAAEASKPLMAYYRRGHASIVGVSSTLVAGALQTAILQKPGLTYAAFDPEKVEALQKKVEAKIADPTNAFSLHFLDQLLLTWAGKDNGLRTSVNAVVPGLVSPTKR